MTVRVYSKPACQACVMTKNLLRKRGVPFVEEDITEENNLRAAKALGHMAAPVVVVGDETWSGFRPDMIDALVKRMEQQEDK